MKRQYRLEAEEVGGWDHIGTFDTLDAARRAAGNGEFISIWEAPEGSEDWEEVDRHPTWWQNRSSANGP